MGKNQEKPLKSIASALDDLKEFPEDVQDVMGYALDERTTWRKASQCETLERFFSRGRFGNYR